MQNSKARPRVNPLVVCLALLTACTPLKWVTTSTDTKMNFHGTSYPVRVAITKYDQAGNVDENSLANLKGQYESITRWFITDPVTGLEVECDSATEEGCLAALERFQKNRGKALRGTGRPIGEDSGGGYTSPS